MVKRNSNKLQARERTGWHSRSYLQQPLGFAFAHLALVNTFKLGAQAGCSSGDSNCSATPPQPFLVPESSPVRPNLTWRVVTQSREYQALRLSQPQTGELGDEARS
jgi:hypothetical protein